MPNKKIIKIHSTFPLILIIISEHITNTNNLDWWLQFLKLSCNFLIFQNASCYWFGKEICCHLFWFDKLNINIISYNFITNEKIFPLYMFCSWMKHIICCLINLIAAWLLISSPRYFSCSNYFVHFNFPSHQQLILFQILIVKYW